MFWVPTLYLAEGLPFYTVSLIAGLTYKSMGVANDVITHWTGLLGLEPVREITTLPPMLTTAVALS